MARERQNPKEEKDLSKITKVILKDLKGRRVVHHNFHDQHKKEFGDEQKETRKIKKEWWRTPHGTWLITTSAIMLIFAIIAIATWESIFKGNKQLVATQEIKQPRVAKRIYTKSKG